MPRKGAGAANWRDDVVLNELVLERSRLAARRRRQQELDRAVAALAAALPAGRLTPDELRAGAEAVLRSVRDDRA
jgi:hypothetical protein